MSILFKRSLYERAERTGPTWANFRLSQRHVIRAQAAQACAPQQTLKGVLGEGSTYSPSPSPLQLAKCGGASLADTCSLLVPEQGPSQEFPLDHPLKMV